MSLECVYGCSHPLWGGAGECIGGGSCRCDVGYTSLDSFGNPSCVPKQALVGISAVLAVVAATVTALTWWHLARHFYVLSYSVRRTRRAIAHKRVVVSGSAYCVGNTVLFCVAVARSGKAPLWDNGMFFVTFGVSYPSVIFCIVNVGEIWLEHLAPQLIKPGSMLTILRRLAKEHDVFLWVGLGCSATFCLVGVLSLIFGQRPIRRSIHLAMMTSCVFAGLGFTVVATLLTRAINAAEAKSPQLWHERAKKHIRLQAGALSVASGVYVVAAATLELTRAGGSTPLIPYSVMLFVGMAGTAGAVHFSKPSERVGSAPQSAASPRLAAYCRLPTVVRAFSSASSSPDEPITQANNNSDKRTEMMGGRASKGDTGPAGHHLLQKTLNKVVPVVSGDDPG